VVVQTEEIVQWVTSTNARGGFQAQRTDQFPQYHHLRVWAVAAASVIA